MPGVTAGAVDELFSGFAGPPAVKSGGAAKSWLRGRGLAWGLSVRIFLGDAIVEDRSGAGLLVFAEELSGASPGAACTTNSCGTGRYVGGDCGNGGMAIAGVVVVVVVVVVVLVVVLFAVLVMSIRPGGAGGGVSGF